MMHSAHIHERFTELLVNMGVSGEFEGGEAPSIDSAMRVAG